MADTLFKYFLFFGFFTFLHLWWKKMLKCWKRWFGPADSLRIICLLVKIHNNQPVYPFNFYFICCIETSLKQGICLSFCLQYIARKKANMPSLQSSKYYLTPIPFFQTLTICMHFISKWPDLVITSEPILR